MGLCLGQGDCICNWLRKLGVLVTATQKCSASLVRLSGWGTLEAWSTGSFLGRGRGAASVPWIETLDQVGLTATTPGFLGEGDACDGLFEN